MRVLAASFADDRSAQEARARLLSELTLDAEEIEVESLAQPAQRSGPVAILAGRFQDQVVAAALEVIERHGGTLLMDIDAAESNA